ncbi:MAG: SlyX family protein [Thermoanaerobaculia bacterium]|nr:SlyX family protein [Thermoanaerobaculia bacterium]
MDPRVVDIEIRLAFQDKLIADLDEVVQSLAKRLDVLERRLTSMAQSLREMPEDVGPADDRPPHY